jgi:hypothetical protein
LLSKVRQSAVFIKIFCLAAVAGEIAPDADLMYFYLLEARLHPQHGFASHYPMA